MTDTAVIPPAAPVSPATEACKRDRIKEVLAYGSLCYLVLITGLAFFKQIPAGNSGTMLQMLAGVSAMLAKDSYGFVFGSSQGSQDKNDTIAALKPVAQVSAPVVVAPAAAPAAPAGG